VNEVNGHLMLSQAFVLKSEKLKEAVEQKIAKKLVNANNCTKYYLESTKLKSQPIQKACQELIVRNFAEVKDKGSEFLLDLPAEAFTELCAADNLYIEQEKFVVELIEHYLKRREGLPLLDEENPLKDWSALTEEERKKRQEEDAKKDEEAKKAKEEEEKNELDKFNALEDLG